jgi:hypothetical protein
VETCFDLVMGMVKVEVMVTVLAVLAINGCDGKEQAEADHCLYQYLW